MKTKQNSNSILPFPKLTSFGERRTRIIILAILGAFFLNTLLIVVTTQFRFSGYNRRLDSYQAGGVADRELVASESISYVDEGETQDLVKTRLAEVYPIFSIDVERVYSRISLFEQFATFLSHNISHMQPGELFRDLELRYSVDVPPEVIRLLPQSEEIESIIPLAETLLRNQLERGVFDQASPHLSGGDDAIELRRWENGEKVSVIISREELRTKERVIDSISESVKTYSLNREEEILITGLVRMFLSQTAFYDGTLTEARKESVRKSISPVTHKISEGEIIFREGEIISETDMEKIEAIRERRPNPNSKESLAILLYIAFIFILGIILVEPLIKRTRRSLQHTIILLASSILFSLNIFITMWLSFIPGSLPVSLGILTAFLSMMISILMTERIGIIASLLFSLGLFAVPSIGIHAFLFSFFAGVTGIYSIEHAEKRIDVVTGTLKLTAVVILLLLVIGLLQQEGLSWFASAAGLGIVYSFITGGLVLALLPVVEHVLNAPTVFRLRELSDTNTPIFRRMITAAPGTYSHSMSVANLAESACKEIGADHLLARVGAYYHDIGKMEQPDYFIENQQEKNRHDEITPNLSVAVIKSHVKLGKEKAKELKLPPEIVEIVADHHGNDVIGYFYSQALKKSERNVSPEEFSYNGVPPKSKESAIVMLADVIEAQSRTIKKPTMKKFDKMVWDAIMRKVTNRQLSRSELSFQEIERVKNSFVQILAGHFHNRIEYPETKEAAE